MSRPQSSPSCYNFLMKQNATEKTKRDSTAPTPTTFNKNKFVHLHTHSHYSLLNALPKITDLVKKAKEEGMTSLALTDNANLYGAIDFYKECKKQGIKPIIGIDAYVAIRKRFDKQSGIDNSRTRLVLLAKNKNGYKNLVQLVTKANMEGFYYKPRIDKELIEKYCEDLICINPSFGGDVALAVAGKDLEKAELLINWYKKIFGDDNFFIEITHHPEIAGHEDKMEELIKLSKKTGSQIVAAHDVYYIDAEDKRARDTLLSIQTNGDGKYNLGNGEGSFSFIDTKEAENFFKKTPEALENTEKIARICNLELQFGSWLFPHFDTNSGKSHDEELRDLVYEGLEKNYTKPTKETKERIEYELKIIKDKGYSPYFLVVEDIIRFAHKNNILTNIRGSVAGSMVTYLLGITSIDPIEYKLPFERFLNPERPSAPDIDMDFADDRRDEVIEYVKKKYGEDKVAQIGTFGTMMARGAVRDVTRALGYPYATGDRIAKLIPLGAQGFPMTLEKALKIVGELRDLYKKDSEVKDVVDMAKKIEGCARHISVHAAGVIISPEPLTEMVPLQFDSKGEEKIITQYDMHAIEDVGLLKFDFLGIRNLSIIADTINRIEAIERKKLDIEKIPLDDIKTFELLSKGETEGLFQLNGTAMTKFLIDLKPTSIHDINAMLALYRPGPMEVIPEYIRRKNNPALASYLDPRMKKFLTESYGLIVYQDDLLFCAIDLAGYSWLEADKFRKAVGKKIPAEMAAQKEKFLAGIIKNGQTADFADKLWKLFEPFQSYGFNKAHAASYGRVAYQTAYLKANYPAIYMSAVLTADSGDVEKIGVMISECKRMGIPVFPPSVNESYQGFSVIKKAGSPDTIRFGLTTIKNFGAGIADVIVKERKTNGKYKTLGDFLTRIKDRNLNKKSMESLIMGGAMDEFGDRGILLSNLEKILSFHKDSMVSNSSQDSLFNSLPETKSDILLEPAEKINSKDKLRWEKELLGLYISGHPLDEYEDKLNKGNGGVAKLKQSASEGRRVAVFGIVEDLKEIITKQNQKMAFAKISDKTDSFEVVVFPKTLNEFREVLVSGKCLQIIGNISKRNGQVGLIVEKAIAL